MQRLAVGDVAWRRGLLTLAGLVALAGVVVAGDVGYVAAQNYAMNGCVGTGMARRGTVISVEWHVTRYTCVYRPLGSSTFRRSHALWH